MRFSVPGERPQGVRLLAILIVLGAATSVAKLEHELPPIGSRDATDHILVCIVLFVAFVLPVGLWYYHRWAHVLLVSVFLLLGLASFYSVVTLPDHAEPWLEGIVDASILSYLLAPRVRAAFWGRRVGVSGAALSAT